MEDDDRKKPRAKKLKPSNEIFTDEKDKSKKKKYDTNKDRKSKYPSSWVEDMDFA